MAETLSGAATALGGAVIFIDLLPASQFGGFLQPVAIMLSLTGALVALLATGSTLNIFSVIGVAMLMGRVTKNAILLVDFANQRQRPILRRTLAMICGVLPMAIGLGDGGESQAPMGRAVIGGVLSSTLLTLVVVPVAYRDLDSWGRRAARHFKGGGGGRSGAGDASGLAGADVSGSAARKGSAPPRVQDCGAAWSGAPSAPSAPASAGSPGSSEAGFGLFFASSLRLAFSSAFFFFSSSFCRFSYWKFVFAICHLCRM